MYEGFWEQGVACGYGCLIQPDGFKHYGLFRNNLLVERLNLQSLIKRDTVLTNQRLKLSTEPVSMVRCKSAKMQAYEHQAVSKSQGRVGDQARQQSQRQHRFSRRPMFNKLMTALLSSQNQDSIGAENDRFSSTLSKITVQYRQLGVNA